MKAATYPTAESACEALAAAKPGVAVFWGCRYIGTRQPEDAQIDLIVVLYRL